MRLSKPPIRRKFRPNVFRSPAPPEPRLHARRDRNNLIDLHVLLSRIQRVAGRVEFLGGLENCLGTQGSSGVVAPEQGSKFADDLLGGGFRDQVAFDLEAA